MLISVRGRLPSEAAVDKCSPPVETEQRHQCLQFPNGQHSDLNALNNVRAWTKGVEVEHDAVQQVKNIASLPIVAGHVAIMPDVHLGKGATVGSVIPTRGAIIPAAVGVDIGCGMCAVRTVLTANDLPDSLGKIRSAIESRVPVGFSTHDKPVSTQHRRPVRHRLEAQGDELYDRYQRLRIMDRVGKFDHKRVWNQVGTLGGGNHFVELCLDESERRLDHAALGLAQRRQDDWRNRDRHGARDGRQASTPSAGP